MFIEIKRLAKQSAVYGAGTFVERFLNFLLLPFYTYLLSPFDLGVNYLIYSTITIFNILYLYGLDTSFLRYYLLAKTPGERTGTFSTSIISLTFTSVIISGAIIVFSGDINSLIAGGSAPSYLIKMGALILFFDVFSRFGFLVLRAEENASRFVTLKVFKIGLMLALNILFVGGMGLGITGILLANLIASAVSSLTVINIYVRLFKPVFNIGYFKELLGFGFPYIFTYFGFVVIEVIDRYFIEYYLGTGAVGIYGVSYQISKVMKLLVAVFGFAWHPFFLSIQSKKNCKEILARILTFFSMVFLGIFVLMSFFTDDILKIIPLLGTEYAGDYKSGLVILPYILIGHFFLGVYVNLNVGIYVKKKSLYLPFVVGASAIANIIGNILLIPSYGVVGAAVSTAVSYFMMPVILYFLVQRIYPIKYEWSRLLKIVLISLFIFFVPHVFSNENRLLVELIAIACFPLLYLITRFFYDNEKARIKTVLAGFFRIGSN